MTTVWKKQSQEFIRSSTLHLLMNRSINKRL
jgi:hypothetical protein